MGQAQLPALFFSPSLPLSLIHQYSVNMAGWFPHRLFQITVAAVILASLPVLAAEKRTPRRTPAPPAPQQLQLVPAAFARGETLSYTVTLNELPAGESRVLLRKERQEGHEVFHVTAQARTSELVEYLYRLRGTADGVFTVNGFTPLSFRLTYKDNDRPRELGVRYDPAAKALLGNTKKRDQTKERTVSATGVYDPITALYFLRSKPLTPGTAIQTEVFTGRAHYRIIAQVVGKEAVQLVTGERLAFRLHPEVFSLDKDPHENRLPQETTLWVAADEMHTPLRLESFIPIGRVVVELNQ
jgi:hypothetical protein